MSRSRENILRSTAAAQFGMFNRSQARAAGVGDAALRYRLRTGDLRCRFPGVYGIEGVPDSWEAFAMEATLWAGEGTAVSHRAAARLWGFAGFGGAEVEISTTGRKQVYELAKGLSSCVRVHRVDGHLRDEITEVEGIPATSARRTIVDLGGLKHPRAEAVLDTSIARQLTSVPEIWLLLEKPWMRGRRGVRIVRDLLIPRTEGLAPTESEAEILFSRLIDRMGLPRPVRQFPLDLPSGPIRVDFAYPEAKIAVEIDGYAWHMNAKSFESDRLRDNELQAIGWTPLRFTWGMLKYEPSKVADLVWTMHSQTSAGKVTKLVT